VDYNTQREEKLTKKINDIFRESELKKNKAIIKVIWDDDLKVYNFYKKDHLKEFSDLDSERDKIFKSKKTRREKFKLLRKCNAKRLRLIC
jgi:hypothetical protein